MYNVEMTCLSIFVWAFMHAQVLILFILDEHLLIMLGVHIVIDK